MVIHWSLNDSESPQVSRTLLSFLNDFNNAIIWKVSTSPVISKSPSSCTKPLVTAPRVSITIGVTVTFMFHVFFNSLESSRYFSFFSLPFNFTMWSAEFSIRHVLLFLLIITRSCRLAEIRWSFCISKSQRCLCVSFFMTDSGSCIYHLFAWSNLNFLHNFQWIPLPTQSCLVWRGNMTP